jgi:hypothetical protein
MNTRSTLVFLSFATLTGGLVATSSVAGCRGSSDGFGAGGTTTSSSSSNTTSGTGGSSGIKTVTIQQMTDETRLDHIGPGVGVQVKGAVAMSIKFKVSQSKSGACLWGVFLSAPGLTTTGANTGVLALSEGTAAVAPDGGTSAYCPVLQAGQHAGDAFPDDIQPGDIVDVIGKTDLYVPTACSVPEAGVGYSNVAAIQFSTVTVVNRTGTGPVPAPYKRSATDLTTLAAGADTTWLNAWGSVLVEADDVTSELASDGLTDNYGHMILNWGTNGGIEVGDALYYVGIEHYIDICYYGPKYSKEPPINFAAVRGFVYLDYCNWSLAPRDKCHDLNPASIDCLGVSDAGADANPALVCTHEPTDFTPATDGG